MATALRNRATAVVIRDRKVLLVNHTGESQEFSMHGDGIIEDGELPIIADARDLYEETGLRPTRIEYLLTYDTSIHKHVAFRIEAEGEVEIEPGEISAFVWWDQKEKLPMYSHVRGILEAMK